MGDDRFISTIANHSNRVATFRARAVMVRERKREEERKSKRERQREREIDREREREREATCGLIQADGVVDVLRHEGEDSIVQGFGQGIARSIGLSHVLVCATIHGTFFGIWFLLVAFHLYYSLLSLSLSHLFQIMSDDDSGSSAGHPGLHLRGGCKMEADRG